jgi:ABC-type nickel/cobalt efflux system permease component RcnA
MRLRILLVVAVLIGTLSPLAAARAADLFGKPEQPAGAAATSPAVPPPQIMLPAPLRPILGQVVEWQTEMNAAMRRQLLRARDGQSLRPALIIIVFAFLYGVAHALGPGHGKVVIGSYFLTRRARVIHGIAMSGIAALVQAISAIVLVGLLALILDASSASILDQAATIELISYGAIIAIGLWMAWGVITGREHDHGHDHGHSLEHAHDHPRQPRGAVWRLAATGAAVGLRPCSGAILVLLFSLANDILAVGVLATFAMAVGVAITVTAVSLTSLGMRRAAAAAGGRTERLAERGYAFAAFAGAILIVLFGMAELVGVWTGVVPPAAG